jgi:hypothetical protein
METILLDSLQLILFLTLGESLPGLGIVGEAPLGFPLNVAIKHEANDGHGGGGEPAPVMYSVVCEDFDVAFSSFFPPMCVTTAKNDCYKVSKPTYYITIHSGDILGLGYTLFFSLVNNKIFGITFSILLEIHRPKSR